MRNILFYLLLLLLILSVIAQPPSERTVRGTIYTNSSSQAQLGTDVMINNTANLQIVTTKTSGPGGNTGTYSTTVLSNRYDFILVRAWNATVWGEMGGIMGNTQVIIDVIMNMTRDSEARVIITTPFIL
jgi:hypothetical protein